MQRSQRQNGAVGALKLPAAAAARPRGRVQHAAVADRRGRRAAAHGQRLRGHAGRQAASGGELLRAVEPT